MQGTKRDQALVGTTLHTLRRSVGTLVAHEVSLDAAREQLGHRDPSITYQRYVGKRPCAPDLRDTLALFLPPLPSECDLSPVTIAAPELVTSAHAAYPTEEPPVAARITHA